MSVEPIHSQGSDGDRERTARGRPGGFLIQHRSDDCRQCWGCVRRCPSRAICVTEDGAAVIEERCVACGACVSECGQQGHVVRDDTPKVLELLASDRPVVAVLATESPAALHPRSPAEVGSALEALGFFAAESTLLGEEMVAAEYERLLARRGCLPTLRSTCPVTVSWVRRFHPQLVEALVPLVPPYVAQARLVKALYPADTAVVYISPCYARKDEYSDPQFDGAVDAAIDFGELTGLLDGAPERPRGGPPPGSRRPAPIKEVSLTDGFPRRAISDRDMTDSEVVIVRGLGSVDRLLRAITKGEAAPGIVDMLMCDGCLDGPTVTPDMSVFAKRALVDALRAKSNGDSRVGCRRLLAHLPTCELRRSFAPAPVLEVVPSTAQIERALIEGGFSSSEDLIDCGACGSSTCAEQATAVLQRRSTWDTCWPMRARRLESSIADLQEAATIDALTDLANRRVFETRLAQECERLSRYGTCFSLLMIDLDGFKSCNDRCGHQAGDQVLRAVGDVLSRTLRASDIPARYGGDEFGVVLPGIGKTEAFAVAEKVRASIAAIDPPRDASGEPCAVTASIGVASASATVRDAVRVLEAADRALYEAKGRGRDNVTLAPD